MVKEAVWHHVFHPGCCSFACVRRLHAQQLRATKLERTVGNRSNDASNPLFVAPAAPFAREPFFSRVDKTDVGLDVDLTVPPDKIFVIESIYVEGLIASTLERSRVALRIRPPGEEAINAPTIQIFADRARTGRAAVIIAGGSVVRAVASHYAVVRRSFARAPA
jgi:hypothetical protein